MGPNFGTKEGHFVYPGCVGPKQLRCIGHDRAIVMVVAALLVEVVGHTWVEDDGNSCLVQRFHMSVYEFGGKTDRV
ncbi:hypothetical protein SDC9_208942 [bioreactor metagenome]|uniref:Uncharacterized protein n=1 Tax=bioreactor metagenome TaxID=1076179 RepID=A0A645JBZ5_9ZZZZ